MPELPEVEAGRKIAERTGRGHRIDAVTVADDPIVFEGVSPARIRRALRGRTVVDTHRHGKHFWLELDARPAVVFHFGMTGALYAYREQADRPRFWKIELVFDHGLRLAMTNARRLGRIRLRDNPGQEPPIADLGFDPYTEMPSPAEFASALRSRQGVVKGVLLNQSFAAGVGNWIADEVLFQARIDPRRRADSLTAAEAKRIRSKLAAILSRAVEVDADDTRFPTGWLFHRRWGKKSGLTTHRGEPIEHITVAGRTTAWVPSRQG